MSRLWAACAVVLACLALIATPVLAQDAAPTGSATGNAWVTGTVACTITTEWTKTMVDGVEQLRGREAACEWFASDPRMSGPFTVSQDMDCYPISTAEDGWLCVMSATFEGSNWTGTLITPVDEWGIGTDHIVQTGTGPNAGWTFIGTNTREGWSGLLYEGAPPPSWGGTPTEGE